MLGVVDHATGGAGTDERDPALDHEGAADPADLAEPAEGTGERRDWRHPSVDGLILTFLLAVAVRIGLQPLHDNSFMTHLATGRLILRTGSVPSVDPYSWTAHGSPWTVQSWGASVIYGVLDKTVGLVGIRLFDTVLTVCLVLIVWRLTRPATGLLARAIPMGVLAAMGTGLWVERPLLIGAVALALVMLAADDILDPRWLVPVMWIWVNTHGSFPFGVGLLVLLVAGRWLDERRRPAVELRALGWAVLGTLLGAINPVGPKLLAFPLELLRKREAFENVAEWEPPHFHRGVEIFFLGQLVVVVALLLWRHRRWRAALPVAVFGVMALTSTRNILQASIVLTPIIAVAASGLGQLDGRRRPSFARPVGVVLAMLVSLAAVTGLSGPDTALAPYPEDAVTYMRSHGLLDLEDRVIARDWVGNYLEARLGPDEVRVFIDDRVDMYPLPVIRDMGVLLGAGPYQGVLARRDPDAILYERRTEFGRWIEKSTKWHVVYRDIKWLVAVPASGSGPNG